MCAVLPYSSSSRLGDLWLPVSAVTIFASRFTGSTTICWRCVTAPSASRPAKSWPTSSRRVRTLTTDRQSVSSNDQALDYDLKLSIINQNYFFYNLLHLKYKITSANVTISTLQNNVGIRQVLIYIMVNLHVVYIVLILLRLNQLSYCFIYLFHLFYYGVMGVL